ncbi:substrate-binding periplasmic protein [Duganella vulcania]|uniref:Transporter substrate-binding domain-containing protein n=1 Tax=Duganella vulcania TaxID=2692166 RepID=A0A845GN92_9BURK|nr:transporter substrate-binding domain-containing protein [Duganella vulcania]MYM94618.1 transporter substrate-binding domain-containing protein [Duganella vulcania]
MFRLQSTILIAATLAVAGNTHAQAGKELVFGTTHEENSPLFLYASAYLQQLCTISGRRCALQSLPGRRSEAMLAAGNIDGEVGRVKGYIQKHPDYARLDEPFIVSRTRIFTRTDKDITSWESLAKNARTVSYKRGIYLYQQRLEALQPAIQPHDVQSETACLQMVLAARDDACVFDDGGISADAKPLLAQGHSSASLEDLPLYIYLRKDNAALAPILSDAARRMAARGVTAQFYRKFYEAK